MKPLEVMRDFVIDARKSGHELEKVATTKEMLDALRDALGLPADAAVVVEGVPIEEYSLRDNALTMARGYVNARWDRNMTADDVESLFKAVDDAEIEGLVQIVIDQHMDMHDIPDPVDSLDEGSVRELRKSLKKMGFKDVSF